MASNSDTIYYVLSYIKNHPQKVVTSAKKYNNSVEMFLDDDVRVGNAEIYFPDQKLEVNRMASEFLSKNSELLDFFYHQTDVDDQPYNELWITTGHITAKHKYLIDLSFE
ncbi:hypothetical protein [Lentilactobacillus sp. Marseille-Q4993]|uniref:hypothetical protein n=1 Tax=Lentilactobacillus sp. Marseille-Q4993 TaxID=3039492 RepID=UPI0024BC4AE0|nr:hypothetical protein [Lentilactobacillus sp. Marseille-Q4993]